MDPKWMAVARLGLPGVPTEQHVGTAFLISERYALTSYHNLVDKTNGKLIIRGEVELTFPPESKVGTVAAHLVHIHSHFDLVLLRLKKSIGSKRIKPIDIVRGHPVQITTGAVWRAFGYVFDQDEYIALVHGREFNGTIEAQKEPRIDGYQGPRAIHLHWKGEITKLLPLKGLSGAPILLSDNTCIGVQCAHEPFRSDASLRHDDLSRWLAVPIAEARREISESACNLAQKLIAPDDTFCPLSLSVAKDTRDHDGGGSDAMGTRQPLHYMFLNIEPAAFPRCRETLTKHVLPDFAQTGITLWSLNGTRELLLRFRSEKQEARAIVKQIENAVRTSLKADSRACPDPYYQSLYYLDACTEFTFKKGRLESGGHEPMHPSKLGPGKRYSRAFITIASKQQQRKHLSSLRQGIARALGDALGANRSTVLIAEHVATGARARAWPCYCIDVLVPCGHLSKLFALQDRLVKRISIKDYEKHLHLAYQVWWPGASDEGYIL